MDKNLIHQALFAAGGPVTADSIRITLGMSDAEFSRKFVLETNGVWTAAIIDGAKSVLYISPLPFDRVTDSHGRVVPVICIPKR